MFEDTEYYAASAGPQAGRVKRRSRAYYAGDTPQWEGMSYDLQGRVLTQITADGEQTSFLYDGAVTTVTNPLSQAAVREVDALGRLVKVTDALGTTTRHVHDAFGNVTSTVTEDAQSSVTTTLVYDLRGRKTQMTDPDTGTWSYVYNALGELLSQTDAKSQTVTMTYDKLGRMVTRIEAEGTSTWTYDSATTGVGKLARVSAPAGYLRVHSYDGYGRASTTTTTITMQTFATTTTYDAAGRVATLAYPGGFTTRNVYTAHGHLAEVLNDATSAPFWQAGALNADGAVIEETLGNGLVTTRGFDTQTGRLDWVQTGTTSTATVQDQAFVFDALGNLTTRVDYLAGGANGRSETFTYDALNRLDEASVHDHADPVYATVSVTKHVDYDAHGNITFKTGVGSYTYGQSGAGPHAVTAAGGKTYSYDANGSMVSGDGRTIAWTSFNKPASIANGISTSTFVYGPERARIQQVRSEGALSTTTKYVGSHFEQITLPNGDVESRHYIAANGRTAIYIETDHGTSTTTSTRYLHTDHLGSVVAISDESGLAVETLSYDPWGLRRETDWADASAPIQGQQTTRGFTDHEHLDQLGLIHMNGRVYDPTLGRFLSADPFVQFPDSTQGYNRYTYVNNNPLSFTDPSGFFIGKLFKAAKKLLSNRVVRIAAAVAFAYYAGPSAAQALLGAGAKASLGFAVVKGIVGGAGAGLIASGGDPKAALVGGLTGAAFGFVGHGLGFASEPSFLSPDHLGKTVAHGVVGGAGSKLAGGRFKDGFLGAAAAQLGAPGIGAIGSGPAQLAAAAVVGGTASALGGGKFANGAVSAAFGRLFNDDAGRADLGRGTRVGIPESTKYAVGKTFEAEFGHVFAVDEVAVYENSEIAAARSRVTEIRTSGAEWNPVTTGVDAIYLHPRYSLGQFIENSALVLHEYFHVLRQFNTGRMNEFTYTLNPRPWEDEAQAFARRNVGRFQFFKGEP